MEAQKIERGLSPVHPGEILREDVLPALKASGVPATRVAEHLGVGRRTLYDLLEGKSPVTADMALRLGKLCGNGPDLWMGLQAAWDLDRARAQLGAKLDEIPTLSAA